MAHFLQFAEKRYGGEGPLIESLRKDHVAKKTELEREVAEQATQRGEKRPDARPDSRPDSRPEARPDTRDPAARAPRE